ncbi:unnamed protein product, partial [Lymnaea stagnalis]
GSWSGEELNDIMMLLETTDFIHLIEPVMSGSEGPQKRTAASDESEFSPSPPKRRQVDRAVVGRRKRHRRRVTRARTRQRRPLVAQDVVVKPDGPRITDLDISMGRRERIDVDMAWER